MKRLVLSCVVLLAWLGVAWGQGQLINGHRTMTGGLNTGTTTGSANAYILTLNPPLPGYVLYQCFTFLANHSNTGAATLNVNGRGVRAIQKWTSGILGAVSSGDIASGQYVHVCYDGTAMQVQSGSGTAAVSPGGGDVTSSETSSVAGQLVLFAGTTGKVLQGYEGAAGLVKTNASGVPSPAVAGTDYVLPGGTVALATALAANPTDCSANTYATTIAASGNLTCSQVNLAAGVTNVLPAANLPPTVAYVGVANLWADGVKQTFNPSGTTAGLNVGSHTSAPSAAADGDLWYDSSGGALMARIGGTSVALGAGPGGALIVTEVDGTPSGTFTTLKFSNGSVANNGDGSATITTGVGGGGDFSSNTATSVDSEVVLFSGAGGKTGKRATGTGLAKLTAGVLSVATAGTDYVLPAGTVALATALTTNGANCAPGEAAQGVDPQGAAEGCFSVTAGLTFGTGLVDAAGVISVALQEPGSLFNGTGAALACEAGTEGQLQIGPQSHLEYCGYETTPLRHIAGLPGGYTWGDTTTCTSDENGGKLTVVGGVIQCSPDIGNEGTVAWNDGGVTSLTCGGGAQGQHQVMDSGRVEYCGGEIVSVLHTGFLLPPPLSFNINTATCTGDANGGKLTINGANQVVCASDTSGVGVGSGDISAVGNLATGDAGTTGAPLTNLWRLESSAPSPPASGQGIDWLDATSKNYSIMTSDGVVKRMVQSVAAVPNQVLTALAPDGAFAQTQLSSANLSDGSALAKLNGPQTLTATQVVPRRCTLSASSGTVSAPNADLCDVFERHDVAGTLTIPAPTATGSNPRPQHPLVFSLCAASQQSVIWNSTFATRYGVPLPSTIPAGGCVGSLARWNEFSAKWETWGATPDSITEVVEGGTGVATLTGLAIGNGTAPFTAATSSTVGQTLRVTGANTYGFGALDLADTDAVTGIVSNANTTAASANTASALVARDGSGNFSAGTITAALTGNATTATALQADLPYSGLTPATAASKLLGRGASGAGDWQELTLGTNLSMSGTTLNAAGGGGGGTGTIHLFVGSPMLPTSSAALVSGAGNYYKLVFDDTTEWCAWWQVDIPTDYASGLRFEGTYAPAGSTTGTLNFDVSVMSLAPGAGVSFETESYDTANNCDDAAIPTTANHTDRVACALTANDSTAAEHTVRVKVCRKTADDTAATQIHLITAVLQYTK